MHCTKVTGRVWCDLVTDLKIFFLSLKHYYVIHCVRMCVSIILLVFGLHMLSILCS